MTAGTDIQIQHIYEQWHANVLRHDLDGLMALYDDQAIFESPLVWASQRACDTGIRNTGILRGKTDICAFFAAGFRTPENGLGRWYRTGTFFSNGRQLTWEYPRETPDGDQIDLVEMMDVAECRIVHHRVYWGWVGFRTLAALS